MVCLCYIRFDLQRGSKDVTFWRSLWLLCHPNKKYCAVPYRRPRSLLKHAGVMQRNSCILPLTVSLYSWFCKRSCRLFLRHFPSPARSIIVTFSSLVTSLQTHQQWGTGMGTAKLAELYLAMTPIQLSCAQILILEDKMPMTSKEPDSGLKTCRKVH